MEKQVTRYIVFDKIYDYHILKKQLVVYDWHTDLTKNEIVTIQNLQETQRMNIIAKKILEHDYKPKFYGDDLHDIYLIIFEHKEELFFARVLRYSSTRGIIKYEIYKIKNNKCYLVKNIDSHSQEERIGLGNNISYRCHYKKNKTEIFELLEQKVYCIDKAVHVHRIDENTYYYAKSKSELDIHTISREAETKTIDLSDYGEIMYLSNLKNNIYAIMKDVNHKFIIVYNMLTNRIEIDYSLGSNPRRFKKYGNVLLVYNETSKDHLLVDYTKIDYKILNIKPNIKKIKTHNIYFNFY